MGRKQKLLEQNTGHLKVIEQEAKFKAEVLAKDGFVELQKTTPKHLKSVAAAEYSRIRKQINTLPLRDVDRGILELYCTWYAIYRKAEDDLRDSSLTYGDKPNPAIGVLDKATKNIRSLASELGLTVDSRMRINMPQKEKEEDSIVNRFKHRA